MFRILTHTIPLLFTLLWSVAGVSNNLQISSVAVDGTTLTFDISWENAWSDSINHDAVWVFIKQKNEEWESVILEDSSIGKLILPHQMGAVELELLNPLTSDSFDVYGIEMVYIPADSFEVGDGQSHDALEQATLFGEAFYLMKYEITQSQYAHFLNRLPQDSIENHIEKENGFVMAKASGNYMNGIYNGFNGFHVAGQRDKACNFLTWKDLITYLDWAGLRPITELEFEKACRGPLPSVAGEFAWGTAFVVDANTIENSHTPNEVSTEEPTTGFGVASHGYEGPQGPLRVGFPAKSNTNRRSSGAGYYGNMELSGNLWELTIVETYDSFEHNNGNGNIHDIPNQWPTTAGAGHRGGAWNSGILLDFRDLAVSDRYYIDLFPRTRRNTVGGRGALTASNNPEQITNEGRYKGGSGSGYAMNSNFEEGLSIPEIKNSITFRKDPLGLVLETYQPQQISIFNIEGKKVQELFLQDRSRVELQQGVYFIISHSGDTYKVVL